MKAKAKPLARQAARRGRDLVVMAWVDRVKDAIDRNGGLSPAERLRGLRKITEDVLAARDLAQTTPRRRRRRP